MRDGRGAAARVGRWGVWLDLMATATHRDAVASAREIETLGFGALWVGEYPNRKEPLAMSALMLNATADLVLGTAIASIWTRRPMATKGAAYTLAEASGDRFVLGLGVSHTEVHQGLRPPNPLGALRAFIAEMDATPYESPAADLPVPVLLGALGPKMQSLAGSAADGAISFFVTPEHTAAARSRLGPEPAVLAEQAVVIHEDVSVARDVAHAHVMTRLAMKNYVAHLRRLGFGDDDVAGGGSRRLVDAMVAYGDLESVAKRLQQHLDAGADHVAIHPLAVSGGGIASAMTQLRALTPVLR